MNEQHPLNINLNPYELLAPVISATILNVLKTSELIALNKKEQFDVTSEMDNILNSWFALSSQIQNTLKSVLIS